MKTSLILAAGITMLSSAASYSQIPILKADSEDRYQGIQRNSVGLPVINQKNEKVNYSFREIKNAYMKNLKHSSLDFLPAAKVIAPESKSFNHVDFVKAHQIYTYGEGIGAFGMEKIDANADGVFEIVMGNVNGWSVQQYQSSTNSYQLIHHVPNRDLYSEKLVKLRVTYHESNGRPLVVTAYKDGLIEIYKGTNFKLYRSFNANMIGVNDIVIADANNDGKRDIVIAGDSETKIFNLESFSEHLTINEGAESIQVGQVNKDDNVELVLSTGLVYQAEGNCFSELWRSAVEFGDWIELGNIDDDEQLEIIGADSWSRYRAMDAVEQTMVWEEQNFDTNSFRLIDVTGDDIPEIILGDGQWGDVHAHDIKTRELIWSIDNPEHGVTNTLIFDGDNDGNLEVYWGAGYTSSGGDYLFAYDLTHQQREWQSLDISGPFAATAVGDIDHDGKLELAFASWESDSGYEDGIMYILDAKSFKVKHVSDGRFFGGIAWTGIHDIALDNVDDDDQLEVLVTTGRLYDGALHVIDGLTFEKESESLFDNGSTLYAMETHDIDDDGVTEVITGAGKEHTGSPGTFVYAINVEEGTTDWTSPSITSGWTDTQDVHVADIDGDGTVEVLAVNQNISIVNKLSGLIKDTITGDYQAVNTIQRDADKALEILAAKSNGAIEIIDGETLQAEATINLCSGAVNAVYAMDNRRFLATCGSEIVSYDLETGLIDWSDDTGDTQLGQFNNIVSAVVKDKRVFLVGGNNGVYIYKGMNPPTEKALSKPSF